MDAKTEPTRKEASLEDVVAELNGILASGRFDSRVCVLVEAKGKRHVLPYPVRVLSFVTV